MAPTLYCPILYRLGTHLGPEIMVHSSHPLVRASAMVTVSMDRKLAALLSADVTGYSRLMGENEEATVRTLMTYRQVMFTLIGEHRGRVVDAPGDNLLAEFASVVDAVQSAIAIQREIRARNGELPLDRRLEFRVVSLNGCDG